ncbi:hypothetical protein A3850_018925 [Lewinella sp. 4G2]|nr:hypothetical protein A3850_018925 [Lewinella sp. 4G2]
MIVSGIFHPLFVPTYMFLLLVMIKPFLFGSNDFGSERTLLTLLMMVLYTAVIPVISIIIMRLLNMVSSIMMEDKMERIGPLLMVMIIYFWIYYNLSQEPQTPTIFSAFLLGVVIGLAVAFVINVMDKISLHAVGMGGLAGMAMISAWIFRGEGIDIGSLSISVPLVALIVILLAGLVGTARLALKAHDNFQLYTGYTVGFLSQFIALAFYF